MLELRSLIQDVPDFPLPGIIFRDITPLLQEPGMLLRATEQLAAPFRESGIDRVAAVESRGFIFGAPLAVSLGCGFAPVRKLGKLPRATIRREYALEYGTNHLEIHADAIRPGDRVLVVDDVLATGGTARATADLIQELGGTVVAMTFLIELAALNGRGVLGGLDVFSIVQY